MQLAQQILAPSLEALEPSLKAAISSGNGWINKIMFYIVKRKGKQLRPLLVLLCGQINGTINESTYRAANLVEILHTATLVHDDVVDNANTRRGFFSLNALWGRKAAVLTGDYLLAKGLLLALENKDFFILEILSDAVRAMSEGELLQFEKARRLDITEAVYFDVIKGKTASLFAAACAVGAYSTKPDPKVLNQFKLFGEKAGIAFQIKDDLLDYGTNDIGKPTGNDIKERKMTLPLIYTLQNCSSADKKFIINTVKNNNNNLEAVKKVIALVTTTGGIDYAQKVMEQYRDEALLIIKDLPESQEKLALQDLVLYLTNRKK
jgi:octaprenyl-diphosphate synthase